MSAASRFTSFRGVRDDLSARHQTALRHPCRLAAETAHPRFAFTFGGSTVVLTVNAGYE